MNDNSESTFKLLEILNFIFEDTSDLICILNESLEYEWFNQDSYESNLGYSKEDLIGTNATHLIYSEDREYGYSELKKIFKKGEGQYITRVNHKDGSIRWVKVRAHLFKSKDEINRIFMTARDITERKQIQEKLKVSELRYRYLFERAPSIIVMIDMDGTIIDVNEAANTIGNWTKDDLIGKDFKALLSVIPQEYLSTTINMFRDVLKRKTVEPKELQFKKKDGTLVWISLQGSVVKLDDQSFVQVIIDDISETKDKILQLEKVIEELKQK